LVDQIKNEVGVDQAQQFNADATAALAGLTQNLQGSKGQLETALGVVTGQAPAVPGADMAPAEMPVPDVGSEELPAPEEEEEESSDLEVSLGRGRR
jgi:outer membrane protein TolC